MGGIRDLICDFTSSPLIPLFISLAGFLTARILADYFEKVIIIEPNSNLDGGSRVPQRQHLHVYNNLVLRIFRRLFPNLDNEVRKEGGMVGSGWMRRAIGGFQPDLPHREVPDRLNLSRPK